MTTHSTSTAIARRTLGGANRRALWQVVATLLLFVVLAWLALTVLAHGASPLPATGSPAAVFSVQAMPAFAAGLPAVSTPFTLTVLATNDTWGYLDPCG